MAIRKITKKKHNRTITVYEVQVSGRDNLGKRIQKKRQVPNKTQALEIERHLKNELDGIRKHGQPMLFSDFIPTYLDHITHHKKKTKGSIASEKAALLNHAVPVIGNLQLRKVTPTHINTILYTRMEKLSGQSKRHCRNFMNALFELAILHGHLETNPVSKVPAPKVKRRQTTILNLQQLKKLLKTAQKVAPEWMPHHMLAVSAMRAGEIRGLQWSAIDWENTTISIRQSYTCKDGIRDYTKNGTARIIPMNPELRSFLLKLKAQADPNPSDFIATHHKEFMKDEQAKIVRALCREARVPETDFHRLRSAAITAMYQMGLSTPVIMAISGHKRLSSTQHYYDLSGVRLAGATDKISFLTDTKEGDQKDEQL